MRKLEVLSPAGDLERVKMAVTYGADAVYLSGPGYGMRPAGRMSVEDVAAAAAYCHSHGAKIYITVNTTPTDTETDGLPLYLCELEELGADAVIVGDVGVLMMARQYIPGVDVHISTQTGVMNAVTARAFYELGAKRIIPARELSLEQLRELRRRCPPELEIEAFVHGSMCVSFSGRCLLSNYLASRDVSSGQCAQPCRWRFALMEERLPGEYFPISEEENGTYILNSKDMCLIDQISDIYEAGISSLKIEGRTKSAYYVATVTNAYRHAADAAMQGEPLEDCWRQETEAISHRPYSTGFYYGQPGQHTEGSDYYVGCDIIAVVESSDAQGLALVQQRNKFAPGDELELVVPRGGAPVRFVCGALSDAEGFPLGVANRPMQSVQLQLPFAVPPMSILRRRRENTLFRRSQP
ncbi:MAG: U32 family peptidase [Oscillospiraceae bacterium]|nr:U32 family peptidase [Oscillospiraceae bacterium]